MRAGNGQRAGRPSARRWSRRAASLGELKKHGVRGPLTSIWRALSIDAIHTKPVETRGRYWFVSLRCSGIHPQVYVAEFTPRCELLGAAVGGRVPAAALCRCAMCPLRQGAHVAAVPLCHVTVPSATSTRRIVCYSAITLRLGLRLSLRLRLRLRLSLSLSLTLARSRGRASRSCVQTSSVKPSCPSSRSP